MSSLTNEPYAGFEYSNLVSKLRKIYQNLPLIQFLQKTRLSLTKNWTFTTFECNRYLLLGRLKTRVSAAYLAAIHYLLFRAHFLFLSLGSWRRISIKNKHAVRIAEKAYLPYFLANRESPAPGVDNIQPLAVQTVSPWPCTDLHRHACGRAGRRCGADYRGFLLSTHS